MGFRIYKEEDEKKKKLRKWAFKSYIDEDGGFVIKIVDAETGKHIKMLFRIASSTGVLYRYSEAQIPEDYEQGLSFTDNGRLKVWPD